MASRFNFRVWGKNTKNFVIGMNIFMRYNKYALSQIDKFLNPITLASENYIIMQSTGLKDANGKEIFEGDILEDKMFEKYFIKYSDTLKRFTICSVHWSNEEDYCGDCDWDEYIREDFEKYRPVIIGNIYENKELLEKQDDKNRR